MTGLLEVHRQRVQPEWVDYDNCMNDAYYMVIFSDATTAFMEHIGLGEKDRAANGHSLFTMEIHLNYLRDIRGDMEARVELQILGHDQKRLHVFYLLYAADSPEPCATNEQMLLNVDMSGPKSAPFLPEVLAKIEAIEAGQAGLPRPVDAGRAIGLARK